MTKKRGKLWFCFTLFGLPWEARIAPVNSTILDKGKTMAVCMYNERKIYLSDNLTLEQQRTTFAHELQHAIEDHSDVDYEEAVSPDVSDRCTDNVARGWIYIIRHCPAIIDFLRAV